MTDLWGRFVTWVRGAIFGEPASAPALEEVLTVEESVRKDDGNGHPEVDEPISEEVPSAMETPLLTEAHEEEPKEGNPGDHDEQAFPPPASEGVPLVIERPDAASGGGTSSTGTGQLHPGPALATVTISSPPKGWEIRPIQVSKFEKVGRAYVDSGDLVIRLDKDPRTFYIREHELDKALTDGKGKVRTTGNSRPVGTTRVSTSGRALNIMIEETLYTIPMRSIMPVLAGKNRKAAVWRGK